MNDQDRINQLEIERDEAKCATDFANLRITQLEASCAAMREALAQSKGVLIKASNMHDMVKCSNFIDSFVMGYTIDKALSTDADKSLLDRLQAVEKERKEAKVGLEFANALINSNKLIYGQVVRDLEDRLQAVEKSHTALRLASEELIACVRHGDQEDIGEAMAKVEAILQPKEQ